MTMHAGLLLAALHAQLAPMAPPEFKEVRTGQRATEPGCLLTQHDCARVVMTLGDEQAALVNCATENKKLKWDLTGMPGWTSLVIGIGSGVLLGFALGWKVAQK